MANKKVVENDQVVQELLGIISALANSLAVTGDTVAKLMKVIDESTEPDTDDEDDEKEEEK